jgi:hypothetical protein
MTSLVIYLILKFFYYLYRLILYLLIGTLLYVNTGCKNYSKPLVIKGKISPKLIWHSKNEPTGVPFIFYTPHQDDETIGMGGVISEMARISIPVYVVLLTDGYNLDMLKYIRKTSPNYIEDDVRKIRNNEFIAACKALGVHRIYIANNGKGFSENLTINELKNNFHQTYLNVIKTFPGSTHNTVSGIKDTYDTLCSTHSTHYAATLAMEECLIKKQLKEAFLYRVYVYYKIEQKCSKEKPYLFPISKIAKEFHNKAINEYKYVDTKINRFGLAYNHSVATLLLNCEKSEFEYQDHIILKDNKIHYNNKR